MGRTLGPEEMVMTGFQVQGCRCHVQNATKPNDASPGLEMMTRSKLQHILGRYRQIVAIPLARRFSRHGIVGLITLGKGAYGDTACLMMRPTEDLILRRLTPTLYRP